MGVVCAPSIVRLVVGEGMVINHLHASPAKHHSTTAVEVQAMLFCRVSKHGGLFFHSLEALVC